MFWFYFLSFSIFPIFWFWCWFFDFFYFLVWEGRRDIFWFWWFFSISCFFIFCFGWRGRIFLFFWFVFPCFFCFSDQVWPAPLLARLLAPFFWIKPFCAQTFTNHPWPQKTLANKAALRDNLLLMSCFLGPWTSLRRTPLAQDHNVRDPPLCCVVCRCCVVLCCVVLCCGVVLVWCGVVWCGVVWCVGAVCVQNFRGCVQNLGAPPLPDPPPLDDSPRTPNVHNLRVIAFNHHTTKIPRNDPQERKKEWK